jgi:LysM repeat protein
MIKEQTKMIQWRPRLLILTFLGIGVLLAMLLVDEYVIKSNPQYSVKVLASTDRYTVKSGDSLFGIAGKYGTTIATVKNANGLKSDEIRAGQVLEIPLDRPAGSNWYTVKDSDSLYWIASQYGVTLSALKAANSLTSELIYPGQILTIPAKGWEPAVSRKPQQFVPENSSPQRPQTQAPVSLAGILDAKGLTNAALTIVVDKSDHVLSIYAGSQWLKSYHVELGDSGLGDKAVSGDHKTPEGNFYIAEKSVLNPPDQFLGSRWMRLSYPNVEDAGRGLDQGIIDQSTYNTIVSANNNREIPPQSTALGGGVGIHGGDAPTLGKDWTWGCVGLQNQDVEDFYNFVGVGTPVVIRN